MKVKIGFIGGGNMAQAIIGGLLNQGFDSSQIQVYDPSTDIQQILSQKQIGLAESNRHLLDFADVIILAVKPQMVKDVLLPLRGFVHHQLIISIMAGIEISTIGQLLGCTQRIVRVMPNTPSLLQLGASGAFAKEITTLDKDITTNILQSIGLVVWLKEENEIDAVTAISGSGPAYFFYLMEHMIQSAQSLGLDAEIAKQLVLQTAVGSAQMAMQSEDSPAQLRQKVTSPNGTTQKAIDTFNELGVGLGIQQGLKNAKLRSRELAEQLKS